MKHHDGDEAGISLIPLISWTLHFITLEVFRTYIGSLAVTLPIMPNKFIKIKN
jgi:hypothetical protein